MEEHEAKNCERKLITVGVVPDGIFIYDNQWNYLKGKICLIFENVCGTIYCFDVPHSNAVPVLFVLLCLYP